MKSIGLYAGSLLIVVGISLATYTLYDSQKPRGAMNLENFKTAWERDIAFLKEKQRLHEGFESLKMVEIESSDSQVRDWIEGYRPEFGIQSMGMYKLEVLLDIWNDGRENGVIVQYHLVNLASGDTVWELGRTLTLTQ